MSITETAALWNPAPDSRASAPSELQVKSLWCACCSVPCAEVGTFQVQNLDQGIGACACLHLLTCRSWDIGTLLCTRLYWGPIRTGASDAHSKLTYQQQYGNMECYAGHDLAAL